MATWNVGPFDNDDAVEWCERLHHIAPDRRTEFVESTLTQAVALPSAVTAASSSEVVAAAAIVLQTATGALAPATPYGMSLAQTEGVVLTPQLVTLARAALEVILAKSSAYRLEWAGDVEEELAVESVEQIYNGLSRAAG